MRQAFNETEYQAGFEHMRQAMLAGLQQLPDDFHAGSWTIGAYCALVRVVWDRRDPGSSRIKVGAVLGTVLSDVLREADGAPQEGESPILSLLEAFSATTICCSPRDSEGAPLTNGDIVLEALAAYAAKLLITAPNDQILLRTAEFSTLVEDSVEELERLRRPQPFRPTVIEGGASGEPKAAPILAADERALARHALGLPNGVMRSYRNRYFAPRTAPAWFNWSAMVDAGLATFEQLAGTNDRFELTRAGAEAALDAGESLDPEDFPNG